MYHLVYFVFRGARHGLQLSGKLQRLEQQEELLLVNKLNKRGIISIKDTTKANTTAALEQSVNSEKKRKHKYIQDESKGLLKKRSKKDKTK